MSRNRLARCGWGLLASPVPGTAIITGLLFAAMVLLLLIGAGSGVVNPPYNISVGDWLK